MNDFSHFDESIATQIVDAAIKVHKGLGPGLLEKVYEVCFCRELNKRGLRYKRQVVVPIHYDGETFDEGFRLDVLIEDRIICEIKAAISSHPVWEAQLLSYMKLSNKQMGFILNFSTPLMKDGIKRMALKKNLL